MKKSQFFLDGYTIYPEIVERGTRSVVKKAIRSEDNEVVAIKIINRNESNIVLESLQNEYEVLRDLSHPNILKMYNMGQSGMFYYVVMPFYSNGDINTYATKNNITSFSEGVSLHIFNQLLNALEYLHNKNIAHRDVKLENLLISNPNSMDVILIDFGFAAYQTPNDPGLDDYPGSMAYASPEIFKGIPYRGTTSDIWSAGISLYVLLVGEYPFYGNNYEKFRNNIIHDDLAPHPKLDGLDNYKKLIKWMLSKDPQSRPSIPAIRLYLVD